jgi:hypothetical protein
VFVKPCQDLDHYVDIGIGESVHGLQHAGREYHAGAVQPGADASSAADVGFEAPVIKAIEHAKSGVKGVDTDLKGNVSRLPGNANRAALDSSVHEASEIERSPCDSPVVPGAEPYPLNGYRAGDTRAETKDEGPLNLLL